MPYGKSCETEIFIIRKKYIYGTAAQRIKEAAVFFFAQKARAARSGQNSPRGAAAGPPKICNIFIGYLLYLKYINIKYW